MNASIALQFNILNVPLKQIVQAYYDFQNYNKNYVMSI